MEATIEAPIRRDMGREQQLFAAVRDCPSYGTPSEFHMLIVAPKKASYASYFDEVVFLRSSTAVGSFARLKHDEKGRYLSRWDSDVHLSIQPTRLFSGSQDKARSRRTRYREKDERSFFKTLDQERVMCYTGPWLTPLTIITTFTIVNSAGGVHRMTYGQYTIVCRSPRPCPKLITRCGRC